MNIDFKKLLSKEVLSALTVDFFKLVLFDKVTFTSSKRPIKSFLNQVKKYF